MTARVLQFGVTGQVAREILAQAGRRDLAIEALDRAQADLADPDACAAIVRARRPDLVILAGAYTAVDLAETETELAMTVNAAAPGAIARACKDVGAALVWFSTDYVFAGDKGAPYTEDDATGPLNAYGASKLAGEAAVLAACPRAVILRTSWVVSAHGKNFVKTMLRVARAGQPLSVVDDQHGRPTAAADLAEFVLDQAPRWAKAEAGDPLFGLFHFANAGEVSWKGFAQAILELGMGREAPAVTPIATAQRPAPAARPLRGTLDTAKLERVYGLKPRSWREPLAAMIADITAAEEAHPA